MAPASGQERPWIGHSWGPQRISDHPSTCLPHLSGRSGEAPNAYLSRIPLKQDSVEQGPKSEMAKMRLPPNVKPPADPKPIQSFRFLQRLKSNRRPVSEPPNSLPQLPIHVVITTDVYAIHRGSIESLQTWLSPESVPTRCTPAELTFELHSTLDPLGFKRTTIWFSPVDEA